MNLNLRSLPQTRLWRSIFRHGVPDSNRASAETVFSSLVLHLHPVKVPTRSLKFTKTFALGGLSLSLFLILGATGGLLMLYYRPAVPQAFNDMRDLQYVVSSGQFIRNMHRWSAHLMVVMVVLHMMRVFFAGAYRPPREFNWVIGVLLLAMTLLLSYTGYLLPWDQLAYWAVTVGTNMIRATPVAGDYTRFLLLGGNIVGENALVRFYVLHCFVLPAASIALMAVHFWRVRKDGGVR